MKSKTILITGEEGCGKTHLMRNFIMKTFLTYKYIFYFEAGNKESTIAQHRAFVNGLSHDQVLIENPDFGSLELSLGKREKTLIHTTIDKDYDFTGLTELAKRDDNYFYNSCGIIIDMNETPARLKDLKKLTCSFALTIRNLEQLQKAGITTNAVFALFDTIYLKNTAQYEFTKLDIMHDFRIQDR